MCVYHRAQQEQLASLEQEQQELESKMEQVKMSVENAKSELRDAQTYLSRLQQDEFRVKQVNNNNNSLFDGMQYHN